MTGSWDGTARIWDSEKEFECNAVLEGHEGAVWDVLFIKQSDKEGDTVLTGPFFLIFVVRIETNGRKDATASADKLIMLWKDGKQTLIFKGHTEAVRAIAKVCPEDDKGNLFASVSNDTSVSFIHLLLNSI